MAPRQPLLDKTYSTPAKEWPGFAPIGYRLSLSPLWEVAAQRSSDQGSTWTDTTVGKVVEGMRGQEITEITKERGVAGKLILLTTNGQVWIMAQSFVQEVLRAGFELNRHGIDAYWSEWFYFEEDHVTDDMMRSFSFFVVNGGKILPGIYTFVDSEDTGFDPAVFEPAFEELADKRKSSIWRNTAQIQAATVNYWYRRFYTETDVGKLVVLRPDEPTLYCYPEGRFNLQVGVERLEASLLKLRTSAGILILLLIALLAVLLWNR